MAHANSGNNWQHWLLSNNEQRPLIQWAYTKHGLNSWAEVHGASLHASDRPQVRAPTTVERQAMKHKILIWTMATVVISAVSLVGMNLPVNARQQPQQEQPQQDEKRKQKQQQKHERKQKQQQDQQQQQPQKQAKQERQ